MVFEKRVMNNIWT